MVDDEEEFAWRKAPGCNDKYEIKIYQGDTVVYSKKNDKCHANITGLKNGKYSRNIETKCANGIMLSETREFEVKRKTVVENAKINKTDFDYYKDGVLYEGSDTEKMWFIGDYVSLDIDGEQNSAEIKVDPVTGSKALKLTYLGKGSIASYNWFSGNANQTDLDKQSVIIAGYKARIEHYAKNAFLYRFNAFTNKDDWYGTARIHGYNNSLILNRGTGKFLTIKKNLDAEPDKYFESNMLFNSSNLYTVVNTNSEKMAENVGGSDHAVARASFEIKEASGDFQGGLTGDFTNYYGKGSTDKPTVVWLDDLYFKVIKEISADVKG